MLLLYLHGKSAGYEVIGIYCGSTDNLNAQEESSHLPQPTVQTKRKLRNSVCIWSGFVLFLQVATTVQRLCLHLCKYNIVCLQYNMQLWKYNIVCPHNAVCSCASIIYVVYSISIIQYAVVQV